MSTSAIPDTFGVFPFSSAFTADEFRTFFVWCARQGVSDVDLVGGSPVSVSRYGRREKVSAIDLPNTMLGTVLDDLLGPEVRPPSTGWLAGRQGHSDRRRCKRAFRSQSR